MQAPARGTGDDARPRAGSTILAAAMSEAELERHVRRILADVAALTGCPVKGYHTYSARKSPAGFPDWVFAGPGGTAFRELKTATGRLSGAQAEWLRILRMAGADADVWRPGCLLSGRIARELAGIAGIPGARAGGAG